MEIKSIRTEADYEAALKEIEKLMESRPDTPEGDRMEVLNRKRGISLEMIRRLYNGLGIPADLIMGKYVHGTVHTHPARTESDIRV